MSESPDFRTNKGEEMVNLSDTPSNPVSWADLSEMAENSIVAKRIEDVQDSVARWGLELDPFFDTPDERMGYSRDQWLQQAVYAHLVYDGLVVHPSYTLNGDLHSLGILDTTTIKIIVDSQGFIPQSPTPAYQQILYGFPRTTRDDDGDIVNGYTTENLAYYIRWPRAHTVYGYSAVEDCIGIPDRALDVYCAGSKYFEPTGVATFLRSCVQDLTRRFVYGNG